MNDVSKVTTPFFPNEAIGNMTLNEIMNSADTDIIKRGNKLSMRRKTASGVFTFEYAEYDSGRQEAKSSNVPTHKYKKDFEQDVVDMKRQGYLQKDIAFELGMSEAYVSRILKKRTD